MSIYVKWRSNDVVKVTPEQYAEIKRWLAKEKHLRKLTGLTLVQEIGFRRCAEFARSQAFAIGRG